MYKSPFFNLKSSQLSGDLKEFHLKERLYFPDLVATSIFTHSMYSACICYIVSSPQKLVR